MKKLFAAAFGASLFALAACGGSGDDEAAERVEDRTETEAEGLEEAADAVDNEAAAEALRDQAETVRETGEERADAIDDADVDATGNR